MSGKYQGTREKTDTELQQLRDKVKVLREEAKNLRKEVHQSRQVIKSGEKQRTDLLQNLEQSMQQVQSWRDKYQAVKAKLENAGEKRKGGQRTASKGGRGARATGCYQCGLWQGRVAKLRASTTSQQKILEDNEEQIASLKRQVIAAADVAGTRKIQHEARVAALQAQHDALTAQIRELVAKEAALQKKCTELEEETHSGSAIDKRLQQLKPDELAETASTAILQALRRQLVECQLALGVKKTAAVAISSRRTTVAQEITLLKKKLEWLRITIYKARSEVAKLCVTLVPSWDDVFGTSDFLPMQQSAAYYLVTMRKMINAFRASINVKASLDGSGAGVAMNTQVFRAAVVSGFKGDAKARFSELEGLLHSTRETQRKCARMLAHVAAGVNKRCGTSIPCVIQRIGDNEAMEEAIQAKVAAGTTVPPELDGTAEDHVVQAFGSESGTALNDMMLRLSQDLMTALQIDNDVSDTHMLPSALHSLERDMHDVDRQNEELTLHTAGLEAELQLVTEERDRLCRELELGRSGGKKNGDSEIDVNGEWVCLE